MRKTEFLATACDPKTLTVGQLMQDAVFTCGSRTDALTIRPRRAFFACLALHAARSVWLGQIVSGGRPSFVATHGAGRLSSAGNFVCLSRQAVLSWACVSRRPKSGWLHATLHGGDLPRRVARR